ncbi:MAG: FAD-dependent monooxygenase [Planctomycetota bacterium]
METTSKTLCSTLSADDAAKELWDVIVVGAGLAGSTAAIGLAKSTRRVLLVEKSAFPRSKVCGACLNLDAVASLKTAGTWAEVEALGGQTLVRYQLRHRRKSIEIPLPGGHAVSRAAMDTVLARQAILAGAEFLSETPVRLHTNTPSHLELIDHQKHTYRAKVVVDASGLNAKAAPPTESSESAPAWNDMLISNQSRIGLGTSWKPVHSSKAIQPGTIHIAVSANGYVGLVITEGGNVNLAAAVDRHEVQRVGAAEACDEILQSCDLNIGLEFQSVRFSGTTTLTRQRRVAGGHRLLYAGDSSGYVEPFTGEGMAWALRAGLGVVSFADQSIDRWTAETPLKWTKHLKRLIGPQKRRCRAISKTLRHPSLVAISMNALSLLPSIGHFAVDHIQKAQPFPLPDHWPWDSNAAS